MSICVCSACSECCGEGERSLPDGLADAEIVLSVHVGSLRGIGLLYMGGAHGPTAAMREMNGLTCTPAIILQKSLSMFFQKI